MTNPRYKLFRLLIPFIIFLLGCPAPQPPPPSGPPTGITLLGKTDYMAPGSRSTFLVRVSYPYSTQPLVDVPVKVSLTEHEGQPRQLYTGKSDKSGLLRVKFDVPPATEITNPNQSLLVEADIPNYGKQTSSTDVYLGKVYNVLLSTDKPIYQPGQTIHLRALALDSNDLKAAQGMTLTLTVADPAGNKLMRKELVTSDYGIAATDFVLDSQASSGDYILSSEIGPSVSSRSVEVKPYTLPRFKVDFATTRGYYKPGEVVSGTVSAQYFFGKPVAGGSVSIQGFVTDFERQQVVDVTGQTDASGNFVYEFAMPDYFVGRANDEAVQLDLEISVTDSANHEEKIDDEITVAEQPILVDLIPEAGELRSQLENVVYLHTTYPDGNDAASQVLVRIGDHQPISVTTDLYGLASFTVTPKQSNDTSIRLEITDSTGISASHRVELGMMIGTDNLLLRPDKAEYQIGDTLNIDILVRGNSRTVYLDVIKGRQTFALVPLPVKNKQAQAAINIDGSLLGTLELNAYILTNNGEIIHDRRYVLVNPAPAQIDVQTNAEQYRPGDTATLDIRLQRDGQPMQGAIGVSIVDESVFALGTQEAGFARTYFLLQRELLEPHYQIQGFEDFGSDDSSPYDGGPDSIRLTESAGDRMTEGQADKMAVDSNPQSGLSFNEASVETDTVVTKPALTDVAQSRQIALAGFFAEEAASAEHSQLTIDNSPLTIATGWLNRTLLTLPLIGLAFYDGTRKRRFVLIGMVLITLASLIFAACAPAAPAAPAPAEGQAAAPAEALPAEAAAAIGGNASAAPEPPRLRQFFPETLFWLPEQETDATGKLMLDVPIADSITTWRVSVVASDKEGNLGSAEVPLKVFQDFFVEPDFPRFLTAGDEVSVPVSLFNYLEEKQKIKLEIEKADWFELVQDPQLDFEIGANEVAAAYIPIRVTRFGTHEFKITATGSSMSDAVLKSVEVLPDGKRMADTRNGKLQAGEQAFTIGAASKAIPGTGRLVVKLYPGVLSQVVDGLDAMLREPNGCFEQTSSTTYPNVLILDYLKASEQASPRIQMMAEKYIQTGYQRLVSFEVDNYPGGFSLFGDPPPQLMLTAYGLMEFSDMAQVSYVDPKLIERTANFIISQQNGDGSWPVQGMTIESGLEQLGNDTLLPTAYIVWALADAGFAEHPAVQNGARYLSDHVNALSGVKQPTSPLVAPVSQSGIVELGEIDPYALAMIANALIAVERENQLATDLIDELIDRAKRDGNELLYWESRVTSYLGAHGSNSSIDTGAMAVIAMLRSGQHLNEAQSALDQLVSQRDVNGMYYNTQSTVLMLKALLLAAKEGGKDETAVITLTLGNGEKQTVTINDENSDLAHVVTFDALPSEASELMIKVEGERVVQYQLLTDYYVPWSEVKAEATQAEGVRVNLAYDRTEMKVNDSVGVTATVELMGNQPAGTLMVTLGIPPGFLPELGDFDALIAADKIDSYDFTTRQVNVYITNVAPNQPIKLTYHMTARYPVKAQTPVSGAYDYYSPDQNGEDAPQRIVVELGTGD